MLVGSSGNYFLIFVCSEVGNGSTMLGVCYAVMIAMPCACSAALLAIGRQQYEGLRLNMDEDGGETGAPVFTEHCCTAHMLLLLTGSVVCRCCCRRILLLCFRSQEILQPGVPHSLRLQGILIGKIQFMLASACSFRTRVALVWYASGYACMHASRKPLSASTIFACI